MSRKMLQLNVSQIGETGDIGGGAAAVVDHDPWPAHAKKHANTTPRRSRRQSVFAKEFEKLQKQGTEGVGADTILGVDDVVATAVSNAAVDLNGDHGSAHRKGRTAAITALDHEHTAHKRRQSLLPVVRAAGKGQEVEVIKGIRSDASLVQTKSSSSRSSLVGQEARRSSFDTRRKSEGKTECSESLTQDDDLSLGLNVRRRSRSESIRESVALELEVCASQQLSKSHKLEDQINLQHLVELMRIFHVRFPKVMYAE